MGERKVLNKYYPPDFDPVKIPRRRQPKNQQMKGVDKENKKRNEEEIGDPMKPLENRTMDSNREMDILASLDEMKSMKSRHATVSVDAMLEALQHSAEDEVMELEEEDEAFIKSVVFHGSQNYVHRISDEDEADNMLSDDVGIKRQKGSKEDRSQPTDYLSKTSFLDHSKPNGDVEHSIKLRKLPLVRISVAS